MASAAQMTGVSERKARDPWWIGDAPILFAYSCSNFHGLDRAALLTVKGGLLILYVVNIWDAAVVIQREYRYPYSGALDAANYLRSFGADQGPMFGFLHGVVGVQAYFDHNIFANNRTAFFYHGLPLESAQLDPEQLSRVKPEYIVAYSDEPQVMMDPGVGLLTSRGYELVHFSDGYSLYKQGVFEREVYFIFRRMPENNGQWAWPDSGPGSGQQNITTLDRRHL